MALHDVHWLADLAIALLSIPLILQRVPPNRLYGFRTPRTLADPALWHRANAFAGRALLAAALISAALVWLVPEATRDPVSLAIAFVSPILVAVAASLMYLRGQP